MEYLVMVGVAFIIFSIFFFLVKRLFAIGIALALIYLLFHIGYIWEADEIKEKLKLDQWTTEKTSQAIEQNYQSFSDKRKEHQVLDLPKLRDTMEKDVEVYAKKFSEADKAKMLSQWSERWLQMDTTEFEKALVETKDIWSRVYTEMEIRKAREGASE